MTDTRKEQCKYTQRWGALDTEFSPWRRRYMDLSDAFLPVSGRFLQEQRNQGTKDFNDIYDSTVTQALNTLAAGLMAGMTSPARPWFRLSTTDPDLAQYESVKIWLNGLTVKMRAIFAASNTYNTLHQMYGELGLYATAATIIDDDFENVIHHHGLTAGEYRLATDDKGNVNTIYRHFMMTPAQMVRKFGRDNCSTQVQNLYDRGTLDASIPICHVIEPRSDRDPAKRDRLNMEWRSLYFEKGANNPDKYLQEGGMRDFRVLAPRWETWGGDTYGSLSPGMIALGDSRQLQHQQLRKAQGIDYMVEPPMVFPSAAKVNQVNLLPGGTSFVDATTAQGVRSAFEVNLRLDYLLADIQDVRGRIKSVFYVDLFQLLAQNDRGRMTATEVAELHEEKLLMLGPVLERQHNETLDPLIEITFNRMLRAGLVPPPPPELEGHELQVEFVSILAQAQRAIGNNGIDRFVVSLGQIAALKPEVLDKFNADEWADVYSDSLGVDPNLIVGDKDVALVRQQRQQQQAAAQTAAMSNSAADTAQKLSQTDTSTQNALTGILGNLTGYT